MSKIALEAEAALFHRSRFDELRRLTPKPTTTVQTTSIAAVDASFAQNAAAIITLTTTGRYFYNTVEPHCMIRTPMGHNVSVIVSEVSFHEVEMHARVRYNLGWEKVSCLERCLH